MKQPEIFDGHLHAPFFIYFRRETKLSDEQILDHFGLHAHRYTAKLPPNSTYAVITDAGEWSLIADDWLYQLWRMPSTLNAIESLAKTHDVFAWSLGDCDLSFEYRLYQNGKLVREYTVDSPNFDDQIVRVDFGERLPIESDLHDHPIEQKMDRFCSSLGINTAVERDRLRLYCKPYKSILDLNAGVRKF